MAVSHVEVLVEELSMEHALRALLPKLLGETTFEIYAHQGKPDLLKKLSAKLAAYAKYLPQDHRVLVIVDRDRDDGVGLERTLDGCAERAGLLPRSSPRRIKESWRMASRIAIEELEAWFFGDWEAVRAAYPKVKPTVVKQAAYRRSDEIAGGTCEAFERELQKAGYFRSGLRKIEAARTVAAHLQPSRNTSPSFQRLVEVLEELATPP